MTIQPTSHTEELVRHGSSDAAPILEARLLRKHFGGVRAMNDVSFAVAPGSVTSIVGPNGAGKTTLFDLLSGFLRLNQGAVLYRGRDISGLSRHLVARAGIGRVFQDIRLFKELTVLDNMLISAGGQVGENPLRALVQLPIIRRQEDTNRDRANELLEFIGLASRQRQRAGTLSGGQQRALAIARILMMGADVILLDEPTAGLDPERVNDMLGLIRRLQQSGKTVLLVEHRLDVVREVSQEVICLSQGTKILQGPPDEVLSDRKFIHAYMGV